MGTSRRQVLSEARKPQSYRKRGRKSSRRYVTEKPAVLCAGASSGDGLERGPRLVLAPRPKILLSFNFRGCRGLLTPTLLNWHRFLRPLPISAMLFQQK